VAIAVDYYTNAIVLQMKIFWEKMGLGKITGLRTRPLYN
jgi:hypothetical protein